MCSASSLARRKPEYQHDFKSPADFPSYNENIFSTLALEQPFQHYRAIRDTAPVVRLEGSELLAMRRYADVQQALRSPDILISGKGVGLNDLMNSQPQNLVSSDGEFHCRLRMNVGRPLMPAALKAHRATFKAMIVDQVRKCTGVGWIEGVEQLAAILTTQPRFASCRASRRRPIAHVDLGLGWFRHAAAADVLP